jgi:hypothetical protein
MSGRRAIRPWEVHLLSWGSSTNFWTTQHLCRLYFPCLLYYSKSDWFPLLCLNNKWPPSLDSWATLDLAIKHSLTSDERETEREVQKLMSLKDPGMLHEANFLTFKEGARSKPWNLFNKFNSPSKTTWVETSRVWVWANYLHHVSSSKYPPFPKRWCWISTLSGNYRSTIN